MSELGAPPQTTIRDALLQQGKRMKTYASTRTLLTPPTTCSSPAATAAGDASVETSPQGKQKGGKLLEVLAVAKAAKVELDLKGVINVKKLWILCRRILDTPQLSSQLAVLPKETDGLPEDVELELKEKWRKRHTFLLPDSWLVNEQNAKRKCGGMLSAHRQKSTSSSSSS